MSHSDHTNSTPMRDTASTLKDQLTAHLATLSEDGRKTFMQSVRRKLIASGATVESSDFNVVLTPYSDIDAKLTKWVWAERVPLGALSLLVGTEGLGKTALGLALAAKLTKGTLPVEFEGQPLTVALATPEDDAGATVRKRLEAAGGDLTRVLDMRMHDASRRRVHVTS